MIAAEIDLSIGSLEALSGSVAAVVIINHGYSIYIGIAAGAWRHGAVRARSAA